MKAHSQTDTKQQILDVAERHFAKSGFAGTSLRGIIKDAKVNIAAVAYHYGNKEDLFDAVVHRFAVPVVSEQLRQLSTVKESRDLAQVLTAFYVPPLKIIRAKEKAAPTLGLFLGRMQTEPEPIFSKVDKHFAHCRASFIEALRQCLPTASEADLQWYFEFMLSLIVSFLTREKHIRIRYADETDWTPEEASRRMIQFCLYGMRIIN
jgi:AcrR family transcriptional regulator